MRRGHALPAIDNVGDPVNGSSTMIAVKQTLILKSVRKGSVSSVPQFDRAFDW
jgi:hypothetical protein